MGLINYNEIDFKQSINKENKVINFNGSEIQVVNYLSIKDKYDLIMITLQKSFEDGYYHETKLKMFFDLHIVYMYTNLFFSAEDRADEIGLYDILNKSGLINIIKECIGKEEIENLWKELKTNEEKIYNYKSSLLAFILNAIENLPNKASQALDLLKEIKPEVLKSILSGKMFNIEEASTSEE